jgi:hypothetical protein
MENKFNLCVLPTQMGKTFVIVNKIMESLTKDDKEGRSIHIVFTMNTLLNNKQFSNRLREVNDKYGDSSVCVFASVYKGDYKHIKKAEHIFKDPEPTTKAANAANTEHEMPRIVIACSNTKRFNDCFDIIYKLNEGNTDVKRVFVYFDELHKYIKNTACNIRKHIENINDLDIVSELYAMSASPNNIWSDNKMGFWSNINILQIDNYYDADYIGYNDIHFTCYGDNDEAYRSTKNTDYIDKGFKDSEIFTINFIKDTLIKYPEILSKYSRVFIPANMRRVSHNYLREHLFAYEPSCVIVMLNGIEKSIQYIDNDGDIISKPLILKEGELGDLIADYMDSNNISDRPLVYTGFICVGMGQTLVSEKLGSFTAAIFGYDNILNDTMYQLFGRITGRFKNWKTRKEPTHAYCTKMCKNICQVMEECAKNVVKRHGGKKLDSNKYLEPFNNGDKITGIYQLKNNFEEKDAEYFTYPKFADSILEVSKMLCDIFHIKIELEEDPVKYFYDIEGYYITKYLKKYNGKKSDELKGEDRHTEDNVATLNAMYIKDENKICKYIVIPVYESLESANFKYRILYSI